MGGEVFQSSEKKFGKEEGIESVDADGDNNTSATHLDVGDYGEWKDGADDDTDGDPDLA